MTAARTGAPLDDLTDAILVASRALIGIAARSMPQGDEVTLAQYRALVVLMSHGPITTGTLAEQLGVHPSTTTRLVDRMESNGYVNRSTTDDRREVVVSLEPPAVELLGNVMRRRRDEIRSVLGHLDGTQSVEQLAHAFRSFADAVGEPPDDEWSMILNDPVAFVEPPAPDGAS